MFFKKRNYQCEPKTRKLGQIIVYKVMRSIHRSNDHLCISQTSER